MAAHELGDTCWRLSTPDGLRYLDAYTTGDGNVVTRAHQANDTQHWCFTLIVPPDGSGGVAGMGGAGVGSGGGSGGPPTTYRMQHRSFSGQYLDAYETVEGRSVLRDHQANATQQWTAVGTNSVFRMRQQSSGLYLKALMSSTDDFRVVMTAWGDATPFTLGVP